MYHSNDDNEHHQGQSNTRFVLFYEDLDDLEEEYDYYSKRNGKERKAKTKRTALKRRQKRRDFSER